MRLQLSRLGLALLTGVASLACSESSHAGIISTGFTLGVDGSTVNLTTEGSTDWWQWDGARAPVVEEKSTGTAIGNFQKVGSEAFADNRDQRLYALNWSDGTPDATGSTDTMIQTLDLAGHSSVGLGFSFDVTPASGTHDLNVYVGVYQATAALTVQLGGDSPVTLSPTLGSSNPNAAPWGIYHIRFSADTPGETLNVRWVQTIDNGEYDNIGLAAATLSAVPEPASLGVLGFGGLTLLSRRRRTA